MEVGVRMCMGVFPVKFCSTRCCLCLSLRCYGCRSKHSPYLYNGCNDGNYSFVHVVISAAKICSCSIQNFCIDCQYSALHFHTVWPYNTFLELFFRTPVYGMMAFSLKRGHDLRKQWQKIPGDTDVLVTHGPPLGHGDLTWKNIRAGCLDLLAEVQARIKPTYHIFGHIHEGLFLCYHSSDNSVEQCCKWV